MIFQTHQGFKNPYFANLAKILEIVIIMRVFL